MTEEKPDVEQVETVTPPTGWYPELQAMVRDPPSVAEVALPVIAFGIVTTPFGMVNPSHVSNTSTTSRYRSTSGSPSIPTEGESTASGDVPISMIRSLVPSWKIDRAPVYSSISSSDSASFPSFHTTGPAAASFSVFVSTNLADNSSASSPPGRQYIASEKSTSRDEYGSRTVHTESVNGAASPRIAPTWTCAFRKNSPSTVDTTGSVKRNDMAM